MAFLLRTSLSRSLIHTSGRRALTTKASGPPKKSSNTPLVLGIAGLAGLSAYLYLEQKDKGTASAKPSSPQIPLSSALDKDKFIDFPLKKIEPYNHNTAKFTFALPDNTATLLPVAACVVVKAADPNVLLDDKGKPIIRPYTPISPSDAKEEVEFLIKKYDTGKATPYIFNMKIGDKLSFKGPIPKIPYKPNELTEIGMIAGGSGITPMYQVINHALSISDDKTKLKLIFSNVTPADILLREEFDALKAKHPDRFDVVYVVDKADKNWRGPTGYVTKEIIQTHIAPPSLGDKVKVFVCGPPGQVLSLAGKKDGYKQGELAGILKELGYNADQVFKF